MSRAGAPKATAQGTLARTPFAHLMQFVMARELSGTLAVWPDSQGGAPGAGQDRVLFEKGTAVAMRSLAPAPNLASGLLTLFARRDAPYAFYERQDLLGSSSGIVRDVVDPYSVLSVGVRKYTTEAHMEPVLRQLGGRPVRLRVGFDVHRLQLSAQELELAELLRRKPLPVAEAVANSTPAVAHRVIYLLTLLKGLESVEAGNGAARHVSMPPGEFTGRQSVPPAVRSLTPPQPHPPVAPPASNTPPNERRSSRPPLPPKPGNLSENESAQWDELLGLYGKMDDLNHFELLGLEMKATSSDVTTAYFALVKRWHPDRVSAGLAPLRDPLRELFDRITEAHETLSTEDKRLEYVRVVQQGGGTRRAERMMADVVEAAVDIQKAEVLLRRRAYREALALVEHAIAKSPEEAGNYAMRGWLRYLTAAPGEAPMDAILKDIDRALADNERDAKAHYYKGVVLKRRGETTQALRHFQKASELDTRNIEAQREVRLAQIRKHSQPPPKNKKPGLWGKLFSKG